MLTINADDHPLMREYHRPNPKQPPFKQDKRMVVILPDDAIEACLDAPVEKSFDFMRQFPAERLLATPQEMAPAGKKAKTVRIVRGRSASPDGQGDLV